jgi:hypothetical protein
MLLVESFLSPGKGKHLNKLRSRVKEEVDVKMPVKEADINVYHISKKTPENLKPLRKLCKNLQSSPKATTKKISLVKLLDKVIELFNN